VNNASAGEESAAGSTVGDSPDAGATQAAIDGYVQLMSSRDTAELERLRAEAWGLTSDA
jgi:hypothetical protein